MAMLCDAFPGRLPTELYAEEQRLPVGFLEEVLEARAYLKAKALVDRATSNDELPQSVWIDLVHDVEGAIVQDEIDRAETDG